MRLELRHEGSGALILAVGGTWDRKMQEYVGPGTRARVITVHDGQVAAATAFAKWMTHFVRDDWPGTYERPYSMGLVGGRRGGKSYLGAVTPVLFALAVAGSYPWVVAPIEDDYPELVRYLMRVMPPSWYFFREDSGLFRLANGSTLELRSAHKPENLRRGEASFAFLNEAQKMARRCYENVRGALADTGSLVVFAANPPQMPIGQWVADHVTKAKARKLDGVVFELNAKDNPHAHVPALTSLKKEMSIRDYRIDVGGEFLARTDVVMHALADGEDGNIRPAPEGGLGDITGDFLRKKFNVRADLGQLVSCDFQLSPMQAACVERFYTDPTDSADVLSWTVDEAPVEAGNEDDLIDLLEANGFRGNETIVIADASGEWQDSERTTGRGSYDVFRRRGWKLIFPPDPNSKRNPLILERVSVANARLCDATGRRHAFVDPKCLYTVEALKKWEMKTGFPHRRSRFAHFGDAWTYSKYRLWPRRLKEKRKIMYEAVRIGRSHPDLDEGPGDD